MSEKILIIDDEQDIADLLEVYLINFTVQRTPCHVLKMVILILLFWILCSRI